MIRVDGTNNFIKDTNGNEQVEFTVTSPAVNHLRISNAGTGNAPSLAAVGDDSNVSMQLSPKGTGTVSVGDAGTATATAGAATMNTQKGKVTTESLTTAAGSTYTLTLTNSKVTAASHVFASAANGTNTQGELTVQRVEPGAGSVVILVKNTHASQAFNGTIKIAFFVQ